jgi:hypothetical protein
MYITLQYFGDCPNWRITGQHLSALVADGPRRPVACQLFDTHDNESGRPALPTWNNFEP